MQSNLPVSLPADTALLLQKDKQHIWHPFTQVQTAPNNVVIARGEGAYLIDTEGNRYIDAMASWWVNLHGHCHPAITKAIYKQLNTLEHALFAGFTHQPAIEYAELLLGAMGGYDKVFFSDNGSTAVEVGLKMALQYAHNLGKPKYRVIAFDNAYHGDTFGGMSVAARNAFNLPFDKLLFEVDALPLPTDANMDSVLAQLEALLSTGKVACFIFEPLIQGAGGMVCYSAAHLSRMIALCRQYECPTIADEVMTGFGRTGTTFALQQLSEQPDIVCLSKGITGGYFPLGATVCRQFIYDAFINHDKMKTFFHGHSYTGNPTTIVAAIASLQLLLHPDTQIAISAICDAHKAFMETIKHHSHATNIRCVGTILAMDMTTTEQHGYLNSISETMATFFFKRGIILRPLGNVLYIMPPYCTTPEELEQIYEAIREWLEEYAKY